MPQPPAPRRGDDRPRARAGSTLFRALLVTILGVAVLGSTLALALRPSPYAFLDPIIDVESLIARLYVEEPDLAAMQRGAIDGMLETLRDPYTVYVPAEEAQEFQKRLTGQFVGIGARILVRDGWLTIVSPLEGSPALRAGLQPDDRVAEIDGESTFGRTADQAVEMLQGEPGTPVRLTIERAGRRFEVTLERAHVRTRAVAGYRRDPAGGGAWRHIIDPDRRVAYIRLAQFTPGADRELREALDAASAEAEALGASGLGGLILDLRWNPGGGLEEAVAIADMFLESGDIVSTAGRAFETETRRATPEAVLRGVPILVMVNAQSASASEIVAGALADNGRAVVLGTRSFGKGSVQTLQRLPRGNGAQIKFTTQRYMLPSGRSIDRVPGAEAWGVDPTPGFFVPIDDAQVAALLRRRAEEEVLRTDASAPEPERWNGSASPAEALADPQLGAALLAMSAQIDDGAWLEPGLPGIGGDAIALEELVESMRRRERLLRELSRIDRRVRELETLAAGAEPTPPRQLLPDETDIVGGTIVIRDAQGNIVSQLRITGADLARWLVDAPIEPVPQTSSDSADEPEADNPR